MDIKHLRYFISIVENNFNLSRASQNLYVSQPALSMMINEFEQREKIQLFKRHNSKITGLTYVGENYYREAKELLEKYNQMHKNLHSTEQEISGKINIGIPPLILSVIFPKVLPELIQSHPHIKFEVVEKGAYVLKNELLVENIHFATLLYPENVSRNEIESVEIYQSELAVFCSPKHHFATRKEITWQDLNREKMVIFDHTFMIYQQLEENFNRRQIYPNIVYASSCWDYLYYTAKSTPDVLTILPLATEKLYAADDLVSVRIKEPILWKVTLCRLKKARYSAIESYLFDRLISEFETKKDSA